MTALELRAKGYSWKEAAEILAGREVLNPSVACVESVEPYTDMHAPLGLTDPFVGGKLV